jgi:hypothetical protein
VFLDDTKPQGILRDHRGHSLRFRASADLIWHTALDQDKSSDVPGRQKLLASSALLTNRDAAI